MDKECSARKNNFFFMKDDYPEERKILRERMWVRSTAGTQVDYVQMASAGSGTGLTLNEGKKRRPKSRANGTGTAYKRGNTWEARVIVGWNRDPKKNKDVPDIRTKCGFAKKSDALNYCSVLLKAKKRKKTLIARYTLQNVYEEWEKIYTPRIVKSTMACYQAAFMHFKPLHSKYMDQITAADLQECMDACTKGKRTHQNMKVVAGLLWGYAKDAKIVDSIETDNLYIGKHETTQRDPITEKELDVIREAIGIERYAEYVFCLCYLGFRPGEFLSLRKDHYRIIDGIEVLVNGSKTEAGKDRVVVIPPIILDYIRSRLFVPGTDLLFPQYQYRRKKDKLVSFKQMSDAYFRESIFKPMMARLGIAEGKVPYCARHTYSDKLKRAEGSDKTKAGLMGHTDYAFTQAHYQSTDMDDLIEVAITME